MYSYTGGRNTDELLLNSLDDENLIRACSVNQHYRNICNEEFYKNIIEKRHPYWKRWLNYYGNSYKKLFLASVAYSSKIYETFDVPYLNNPYSPEKLYKKYKDNPKDLYEEIAITASYQNKIDILDKILKEKELIVDLNFIGVAASRGDNIEVFEYLKKNFLSSFDKYKRNWLRVAARDKDNSEVIKWLTTNFPYSIEDINHAIFNTSKLGNIKYLLSIGGSIDGALAQAPNYPESIREPKISFLRELKSKGY